MAKVKLQFTKTIEFTSEVEITVTKKELKEAGYGPWHNHSTGQAYAVGITRHPDDWKDDIEGYITNMAQDELSLREFMEDKVPNIRDENFNIVDVAIYFEGDHIAIHDGPFKWEAEDSSPALCDVEITSAREGMFDGKAPELTDDEIGLRQMMNHGGKRRGSARRGSA